MVGTRQNYVIGYARPPRWNPEAKLIQIDIDPGEIGRNRHADVGIVGDAKAVLAQLLAAGHGHFHAERRAGWNSHLAGLKEIRDFLPRDAILCVDGQEILNYARQAIPFYALYCPDQSGTTDA